MADMTMQEWYDNQFLPWKKALAGYLDMKREHETLMQQHVGQLQTIVALLMEGKSRQALMAWNALQLKPLLRDLKIAPDGESLTLIQTSGGVLHLQLDDLVDDLQRLLDQRGA